MTNRTSGDRDAPPSPLVAAAAERDGRMLSLLRGALQTGRAYLAFQPVVDAADPRRIHFHEALFRIRDPSGREVEARHFMPLAEGDPLGREVDRTALALTLRELADFPDVRLSVNLSARTIGDAKWMYLLRRELAIRPDLAPRLVVEVTEGSAPPLPGLAIDVMAELRGAGVRLALDDFGAGHSSLARLQDHRFDVLKIDGRFVRGIEDGGDSRALVEPMLGLARHFGMLAVVERVETAAQAAALAAMGADGLQGHLHGRPTGHPPWRRAAAPARFGARAEAPPASRAG